MRLIVAALLLALACIAPPVVGTSGSHSHPAISSTDSATGSYREAALWVHRDSHGKTPRSEKAMNDFKKSHPCPATGSPHGSCPGYVIDYVVPLKRGGVDTPSNMRWQEDATAKQMDTLE